MADCLRLSIRVSTLMATRPMSQVIRAVACIEALLTKFKRAFVCCKREIILPADRLQAVPFDALCPCTTSHFNPMKRARVRTEVSAAEAAADRVSSLSPALLSSQGDTCVQSCCINTFPLFDLSCPLRTCLLPSFSHSHTLTARPHQACCLRLGKHRNT